MKLVRSIMLLSLALVSASPAKAAPIKGWTLKQTTDFRGGMTVNIAPRLGKIISRDLGAISRAGSKVWLFNTQNKSYMELSHKEFLQRFGSMVDAKLAVPEKKESSKIFGLNATRYHITVTERKNGPLWYTEDLWATRDLPVDQQFIDECSAIFDIPSKFGVPLKLVRDYPDKRHMLMIQTLDCKPATFFDKDFIVDKTYKKVDDEGKILADMGSDVPDTLDSKPASTGRPKIAPVTGQRRR